MPATPRLAAAYSGLNHLIEPVPQPERDIRFSSPSPRICRSVFAGLFLGGSALFGAPSAPVLDADHQPDPETGRRVSDDGTIDLMWSMPGQPDADPPGRLEPDDPATPPAFQLEQSATAEFSDPKLRYEGPDPASVLTGLREGQYHFRVRAIDSEGEPGAWSEPLVLHVEFMAPGQLAFLLVVGGVVACSTIAAIITGFLKNR